VRIAAIGARAAGALVAVGDADNQRLGDRAAGSTVVYRD
jgi:hypothetical protein